MTRIAIALAALLLSPRVALALTAEIPRGDGDPPAFSRAGPIKDLVIIISVVRPLPLQANSDPSYIGLFGVDSDGRPLDGTHRYLLHIAKDALPPATARWSLTALETDPFRDGLLGSDGMIGQADLRYNADHSLDIYLQHDPPPHGRRTNWLRIPSAPFNLVAHLRGPKPTVGEGEWRVPSVKRLD
jgi:hypothetical protein